MKPRVLLIRENAETLTCSSCAGSLEGIEAFGSCDVPDYDSVRVTMRQMGALYMALREAYGDAVEIDVVDPRNQIFLIPSLIGDYKKFKPALGAFLKTLFFGISPSSVIINGTQRYARNLPEPQDLVAEVGAALEPVQQRALG